MMYLTNKGKVGHSQIDVMNRYNGIYSKDNLTYKQLNVENKKPLNEVCSSPNESTVCV
jgi:hypothetical protein